MIHRPSDLDYDHRLPRLARRIARFGLWVVVLSIACHWMGAFGGEELVALGVASSALAVLAAVLAVVSLGIIWRQGGRGTRSALWTFVLAAVICLPTAAGFAAWLQLPPLIDVASTPTAPIQRSSQSQAPVTIGPDVANQEELYPNLEAVELDATATEAFNAVRRLIERRGWEVLQSRPPGEAMPIGRMEVVARSPLLGLESDAAIEVRPLEERSVLHMRFVARYERHDFGMNGLMMMRLLRTLIERYPLPDEDQVETGASGV